MNLGRLTKAKLTIALCALMVLWIISPCAGFAHAQTTLTAEEKLEQDFNIH